MKLPRLKLPRLRLGLDRWDLITLSGASLLGGGVWALSGPAWACMLWGGLLLTVAALHATRGAKEGR